MAFELRVIFKTLFSKDRGVGCKNFEVLHKKKFHSSRKKNVLPSFPLELSEADKQLCALGKFPILWTAACRFHKEYKQYAANVLFDNDNTGGIYERIGEIQPFSNFFEEWSKLQNERTLLEFESQKESDSETKLLLVEELELIKVKLSELETELSSFFLKEENAFDGDCEISDGVAVNPSNALLEIRAGTGGMEATLFTSELWLMYQKYAQLKGWKFKQLSMSEEESSMGIREACASIVGSGAFTRLQFEGGVHRVQRVPVTDNLGRMHTSTATVAVLSGGESNPNPITLNEKELKVDVYRSSGPGGQHANTTNSAVRVTHLPTGIVVTCQETRCQFENKAKAIDSLKGRILRLKTEEFSSKQQLTRKEFVGTGERHEKIRTYNFAADRITDHRIPMTFYNMDSFLEGTQLDTFIDVLMTRKRADKLIQIQEALKS